MQCREELLKLLSALNAKRKVALPMFLKIAPDLAEGDLQDVADVCGIETVDAVIISNTTISRPKLNSEHAAQMGGLSGKPLFGLSTQQLALFHKMTDAKIPLIGVGGVSDVESAWAKICAGASLIQIYSALVYRGPSMVAEICAGLEQKLQGKGLANISTAVGA